MAEYAEQNAMIEAARKDMIGATMYLAGEEEQEFFKLLEIKIVLVLYYFLLEYYAFFLL